MNRTTDIFDLAVVGGGHAGVEAALAGARMGARVALISHDPARIGALSCNPAIGGLGKGHLVKEIDALGGLMGLAADRAAIQFRRLNTRKGPAVRASRVQLDRPAYLGFVGRSLRGREGLSLIQGEAVEFLMKPGRLAGVVLADGSRVRARTVVLTTGTFLGGKVHVGQINFPAGRLGDAPSLGLSRALAGLGLSLGRLKTGTPPRLYKNSLDFGQMTPQPGDRRIMPFSILSRGPSLPQVECHITRTTARTKEIVAAALDRSSLYGGMISGTGTRYCPSFEDKVVKFPEKESHHVFIEPEGLQSKEVYPNGVSNSLPLDVQEAMIKSLPGCERAVMARPGYAIEYDFVPPTELGPDLMLKILPGLFLAGQINGTSGYEEAGAQGLMAGLNAVRWLREEEPVILTRDMGYTGVMIDDLTTRGVDEPYRMFTSRAEYRLILREDNAAERLTPLGRELGLVGEAQWRLFNRRSEKRARARQTLQAWRVEPFPELNRALAENGSQPLDHTVRLAELLKRPYLSWDYLCELLEDPPDLGREEAEAVEVELKYAGYVAKQEAQVERFREMEDRRLPAGFDYSRLEGLSREIVEKLNRIGPRSLGQAARIPGVTPAAVMVVATRMKALGYH